MFVKRAALISCLINLSIGIEWLGAVCILERLLDKSNFHSRVDVLFPVGYTMGVLCIVISLCGLYGAARDQWKPLGLLGLVLLIEAILIGVLTLMFVDDVIIHWSEFCRSSFSSVSNDTCRFNMIVFAFLCGTVILTVVIVLLQTVSSHANALRMQERKHTQDGNDLYDQDEEIESTPQKRVPLAGQPPSEAEPEP